MITENLEIYHLLSANSKKRLNLLFANSKSLYLYSNQIKDTQCMETLFAKQDRLLMLTSTEIIRTLMHQINWDAQLHPL